MKPGDIDTELKHQLFTAGLDFHEAALSTFHFQYDNCIIYRQFCDAIRCNPHRVNDLQKIPFLPISFFKTHEVLCKQRKAEVIFKSSGTTGMSNSSHLVGETRLYEQSFLTAFSQYYGDPSGWCIIGLLPSYLERENSSLVYMVDHLIQLSQHSNSGFYLYDHDKLNIVLEKNEAEKQKTLLIGVTYALLDFAESFTMNLSNTVIMETGGMKGRKKESTRDEVHEILQRQLGVETVHSEYGMTELLSQAYAKEKGLFTCPTWMKMLVRSADDPFEIKHDKNATGAANIIDLANLYSCSFIAADDLVKIYEDGSFEVQGRLDNCDIRGCGLMII